MYFSSFKIITYYFIASLILYISIYYCAISTEYYSLSDNQLNSLKLEIDTRSCNNKKPNIRLYIVPDGVDEYTLALKILKEARSFTNSTNSLNDSILANLSTLNESNIKSINCVHILIASSSKNLIQESKLPGLHGNYYIFLQKSNYSDNENDSKFLLEISDPGIHVMFYGLKSDENIVAEIVWNIAQKAFFGPHSRCSGNGSKISNVMSALPFHSQYDFNFILTTDSNFRPSWDFHSQVLPIIRPSLDALSSISNINIHSQIIGSTELLNFSKKSQNNTVIDVNNEFFYHKLDKLLPRGVLSKASHFAPPEINFMAYINDFNIFFQDETVLDTAASVRNWGFISTLITYEPHKFYKLSDLEVKHLSGQWFTHLRISFRLPLHLLEYASIKKIDNPNDMHLTKLQNLTFQIRAFEFKAWDSFTNFEYNSLAARALDEYINSTISNLLSLVSISKLHFRMQVPKSIRIGFKESILLLRCSISTLNGENCGDLTRNRDLLLQLRFISKELSQEPRINVSLGLARQAFEISKNLLSDDSMGLINYSHYQSVFASIISGIFPLLSTQIMTIIKLIRKKIKY